MPVMTGFEMTKHVREFLIDEEHVPIIGITGHATIAYKKLAFQSGMDEVVAKPLKYDDFLKLIR